MAVVDESDYEWLMQFGRWSAHRRGSKWYAYAFRRGGRENVAMHRLISGCGGEVDHVNGNGLDNRRRNLREATRSQNMANAGKRITNKSGYKGVRLCRGRWLAQITVNYKSKHLGVFNTKEEAAKAYDVAAKKFFGPFSYLNFP